MREKLKYLALNMTSTNKKLYQMLMDQLLIMLIAFLSIKLTELESYQTSNMSIWISSAVTAFLTIVMLTVTQFYKTVVSAVTINFIKIVIFAALASSFFLFLIGQLFHLPLYASTFVIYYLLFLFAISGPRFAFKTFTRTTKSLKAEKIAIYGAGSIGRQAYDYLKSDPEYLVTAFIDDDKNLVGRTIDEVVVLSREDFLLRSPMLATKKILLAMPVDWESPSKNLSVL